MCRTVQVHNKTSTRPFCTATHCMFYWCPVSSGLMTYTVCVFVGKHVAYWSCIWHAAAAAAGAIWSSKERSRSSCLYIGRILAPLRRSHFPPSLILREGGEGTLIICAVWSDIDSTVCHGHVFRGLFVRQSKWMSGLLKNKVAKLEVVWEGRTLTGSLHSNVAGGGFMSRYEKCTVEPAACEHLKD